MHDGIEQAEGWFYYFKLRISLVKCYWPIYIERTTKRIHLVRPHIARYK